MSKFLFAAILCLFCISCAEKKSENWVQFFSADNYEAGTPESSVIVTKCYYGASSFQTSGFFSWKKVRARVKCSEKYLLTSEIFLEYIILSEVDCAKKTVKNYTEDGKLYAHYNITSENKVDEAFYKVFCQ